MAGLGGVVDVRGDVLCVMCDDDSNARCVFGFTRQSRQTERRVKSMCCIGRL